MMKSIDDQSPPIAVFAHFFDVSVYEHIPYQTNLYASQNSKSYIPTTVVEILNFLGINFLMILKPQTSHKDYWSADPCSRDSYISNAINRDRFSWLLGNLHLNDKLCKVRPLLDHLNRQFQKRYFPSQIQATDKIQRLKLSETIYASKATSERIQGLGSELTVWVVIYTQDNLQHLGLALGKERVVLHLSRSLLHKGYKILLFLLLLLLLLLYMSMKATHCKARMHRPRGPVGSTTLISERTVTGIKEYWERFKLG